MVKKKSKNPWVASLTGSVAGGLEALINWPSEVIKTELQMQSKANPVYTGYINCATTKIRTQGVVSLYRGLVPIVIGSMPKAGVRFGGNSFFRKNIFASADGNISRLGVLGAGISAGASEAILVVTPMETLKTRLINANLPFVSGTMDLLKKEGIRGIYKGVIPTVVKQSMNQGTRFLVYDELMKVILTASNKDHADAKEAVAAGIGAGIASVLVNQPVDVVKTRMQSIEATKYKGFVDCMMKTVAQDGPTALYKGLIPRLARVVPGQGIIFGTYNALEPYVAKALGEE